MQALNTILRPFRDNGTLPAFFLAFAAGGGYAVAVGDAGRLISNIASFFFCTALFIAFAFCVRRSFTDRDDSKCGSVWFFSSALIGLHLGIILAFAAMGVAEKNLWVVDTYEMHLPGAVNVANYLSGEESLRSLRSPFDKIYLAQILVGGAFAVFGVNPFSSGIILLCAKLLTLLIIFKISRVLFERKVASIAAAVYVFSPTILFYTTTFYKEAVVQLIVAVFLLSILNVYRGHSRTIYSLIAILAILLIMNERFYLFPAFLLSFSLIGFSVSWKSHKLFAITGSVLALLMVYLFLDKYAGWLVANFNFRVNLETIGTVLGHFRAAYNNYPDVNHVNSQLPYFGALVKLLFTPFFTINKFAIFTGYSSILIWGVFFNHLIMAFSIYGIYKVFSKEWRLHTLLLIPYLFFVMLFAYVAPYNGRLRDAFYPLISIYAAFSLLYMVENGMLRLGIKPKA